MAPDSPPPEMGHRRPTEPATTSTPGHREGKGQREGPRQEGGERHQVTGTHPREQGTAGNTTPGQEIIGGPPTLGAGQGGDTEGGGREDGARKDTPHRRDRHRPNPPHPVNTVRPPGDTVTGTGAPVHVTDHLPKHTPTTTRHRSREPTAREPHPVAPTQGTTENLPLHPNRQATTPATFHRRGHYADTRARALEGK